jgi:hypothetical protein
MEASLTSGRIGTLAVATVAVTVKTLRRSGDEAQA